MTQKIKINPLLTLENLSVRIRGTLVLKGIDWQIGPGEQWAIVGPNGSGKTTLVQTIAGLLPAVGGNISFHPAGKGDGNPIPTREDIGFVSADMHRRVFEREALVEEIRHFTGDDEKVLTVLDFILDRSEHAENPSCVNLTVMQTLASHLGLTGLFHKRVGTLTTGEISKTLILKALLHEPQLLVMDEPFNGLDRRSRDMVADFIGSLIRNGLQVIIITHRLDEIIPEISHVLLMTAEGVQKMGPKNEVLNSAVLQQVYRIDHDPLNPASRLSGLPPDQTLPSKWGHVNHMEGGTRLVEMVDVKVQYDQNIVLKNVHWTIREGENWMVYGPDGAGKTCLLKLITGDNLQAYANNILLFGQKKGSGESIWDIKQKIGWISSDLRSKYPANIKGAEVVYSGFFDSVGLFRTATATQREQADQWLSALGIEHLAPEAYGALSHGQKQMLLIARAIVKSPTLLLLDEPWEGLDFANHRKVSEIIEYIGHHHLSTVVCTTSNEGDILPCITHQLQLKGGLATISAIGVRIILLPHSPNFTGLCRLTEMRSIRPPGKS